MTDLETDISEFERDKAMNMIKTIDIMAMFYHDDVNGNTYHSSRIEVKYKDDPEGEHDHTLYCAFEYGYDNHYMTTAFETLEDNDVLWRTMSPNGTHPSLSQTCQDRGILLIDNVLHGQTKGIVKRWGKEPT